MACGMLASIGDFIRMGSDDIVKNMYDLPDIIDEEDNATRLLLSFTSALCIYKIIAFRKTIYDALRGFQSLFGEARERTIKAISFGKLLRKDLEVASEFSLTGGFDELMQRLKETDHLQVPANTHLYI